MILCLSIFLYGTFFVNILRVQAVPLTVANLPFDVASLVEESGSLLTGIESLAEQVWEYAKVALEKVLDMLASLAMVLAKIAALYSVEKAVAYLLGDEGGKESVIIRDYEEYLYNLPKQAALKQMKSFLTGVTLGKSSYLNYEGVGTSYVSYIKKQGETAVTDALDGTIGGKKLVTNIQDVADTSALFSKGNMKGLMSYMQCANNPACISLYSGARAIAEFGKAQDIAKSEQQDGLLPKKSATGRIETPAIMMQNALVDIDKQGTNMIVSAPVTGDTDAKLASLKQIAAGALLSIVSRAANYGIVDKAAKVETEVTQKIGNAYYSFSTSYKSLSK